MANEKLFRQEALDSLSGPEIIDSDIKVTKPSVYVILATLFVILSAIIVWGFFGTVTDTASVSGVVFPIEGVQDVSLPNRGTVRSLFVHDGDNVVQGQALAMVSVGDAYSMISAPVTGTILNITGENEEFEAFGPIATIIGESKEAVHSLVAFVPFDVSRKLQKGMRVEITPKNLTREENGYISGYISDVDNYPISIEDAKRTLKTDTFAEDVFPESGAAFEIKMVMDLDANGAPQWSFISEDQADMSTGTFCNVQIITKKRSVYKHLFEKVKSGYRKARMTF